MGLDIALGSLGSTGEQRPVSRSKTFVPSRKTFAGFHDPHNDTKTVLSQAPFRYLYRNGDSGFNKPMKSIQETRRARTRQIIDEEFQGSSTAFAAALKYSSPNFVSRLLSESPKNQKPIGTRLARKIEKIGKKPAYFLDMPIHSGAHTLRIGGRDVILEPLESQLVIYFQGLSRDSQEALLGRAQALFIAEHMGASKANPYPTSSDLPQPQHTNANKHRNG